MTVVAVAPSSARQSHTELDWLFGADPSARARRILALLLFPALVLVCTLQFDFVFDDNLVIFQDPSVVGPFNLRQIFTTPVHVAGVALGYFRPAITLLYRVDWLFWGTNPAGYHLMNLGWHVLTTLLVYAAAFRTTKQIPAAWMAGMLFAILPVHSEAVGWIQGRVDLVPTALLLVALLSLLRAREAEGGLGSRSWSGIAGLSFFAALLAKESAATFPLAWAVWEWADRPAPRQGMRPGVWIRCAPLIAAGFLYWAMRAQVMGGLSWFPLSVSPVGTRIGGLFSVFLEHLRLLLLPDFSLNFFRGLPPQLSGTRIAGGVGMAALIGFGLYFASKHVRCLVPWIAWVPILLGPPLGLVFYAPATTLGYLIADRFVYTASVGWCVALAVLASVMNWRHPRLFLAAFVLVLAGCAGWTLVRLEPWEEPIRFYQHMQAQPGLSLETRAFVHTELGRLYLEREEYAAAESELRAALRLTPRSAVAHNTLGIGFLRQGRPNEAKPWLEEAIRLDPRPASFYSSLGEAYEAAGDHAAARLAYQAGLRVAPDSAVLSARLARVETASPPGVPLRSRRTP